MEIEAWQWVKWPNGRRVTYLASSMSSSDFPRTGETKALFGMGIGDDQRRKGNSKIRGVPRGGF